MKEVMRIVVAACVVTMVLAIGGYVIMKPVDITHHEWDTETYTLKWHEVDVTYTRRHVSHVTTPDGFPYYKTSTNASIHAGEPCLYCYLDRRENRKDYTEKYYNKEDAIFAYRHKKLIDKALGLQLVREATRREVEYIKVD